MTIHRVTLPFPPSVNNLFSQGMVRGKVRRFPSKHYKAWQRSAFVFIKQARIPKMSGPVAIKLTLTPPNAARRDVDNYSKAVLDALVKFGVLEDDSQVTKLLSGWDHTCVDPCVFVEIGASDAEADPLTPAEKREIRKLRDAGARIVGVNHRPSSAQRALVKKGIVQELPGLFEGFPQGYVVAE